MKKLIINADDFGMSPEFNEAITELLLDGKLSSTSLMANGAYFEEAVSLIRAHDLKDIGAHITVTRDGFDVRTPLRYGALTSPTTLCDEHGELFTNGAALKAQARRADLVREVQAQLEKLREHGVDITHVDNHKYSLFPEMGLKGYLALFKAYARVYKDHQAPRGIRLATQCRPIEGYFEIWSGRKTLPLLKWKAKAAHLRTVQYSYSFPYGAKAVPTLDDKKACFERFLQTLPDGVTELHVHPCTESAFLKEYNPTWEHRVHEYRMLKELDLPQLFEKYGIEQTSYRALCEE